jgi:hypothetical protein
MTADDRPMTARARIARFPTAVWQLYRHCQRSDDIHQASRTRVNAWSRDHPLRRQKRQRKLRLSHAPTLANNRQEKEESLSTLFYPDDDDADPRPGRIPRRQYQQQVQIRKDLGVVLPVVALWMAPLVGYVPMCLAILAPRQVLTRHFYNAHEIQHYATLESHQRRTEFDAVTDACWSMASRTQQAPASYPDMLMPQLVDEDTRADATGPLLDTRALIAIFAHDEFIDPIPSPWRPGVLASVAALPRAYLVRLALAVGVGQTLPPPLNSLWTANLLPTSWLQGRVRQVARAVVQDDALLLWEGQDRKGCASLTHTEVRDACLARNLPLAGSPDMRTSLTNHLRLMAKVQGTSALSAEGLGLLTLHLPLLRDFYKQTASRKGQTTR